MNDRERLFAANLAYLQALEANGLERCAKALVDKIEAGLRRQAMLRELAAGPVSLPDAERGRSAFDLAELDRINARLARGYKRQGGKSAEDQREDDLRRRLELEARAQRRREAHETAAGLSETQALAEARGEEVERLPTGARRVNSRDALKSLFIAGHLTAEQHDAGRFVRDCYERRFEGVGSQFGEIRTASRAHHDNEAYVWGRLSQAKALQFVGTLERAILTGRLNIAGKPPRDVSGWREAFRGPEASEPHVALQMLRAVCGDGKSLSSQGEGRAFERNAKALCRALDVAKDIR
ncbi:MAG TPA: hypothetical protein VD970_18050 [Acetobacteraceae bacterium]|nr:hypothetical protein [Acetobacteraceae bacterium]